ncbi:MAG: zinc-ribbon domain-containing protein [Ruegeria sp.]
MRLTCPKCSAQYEVPDDVIPESGRDVQCSNCEHTWFQPKHPEPQTDQAEPVKTDDDTPPPTDEPEQPAETPNEPVEDTKEPEKAEADTGNVDPAVASILQEEAAREAELRAQEGTTSLESQPDLALDQPPEKKVEPKRPAATATASDAGQKDALPDVETINTGLKSDDSASADESAEAPRKSGGFLRGFALILIIGVVLLLVYSNATQISEAVPQADPVLKSYVSFVDQARLWLEAQTGGAAQN